jgi:signal transduction histidine kinase
MSLSSLQKRNHDIRNGLNVIMGSAQLLQGADPLTMRQQKYIERILKASHEMLALLENHSTDISTQEHSQNSQIDL